MKESTSRLLAGLVRDGVRALLAAARRGTAPTGGSGRSGRSAPTRPASGRPGQPVLPGAAAPDRRPGARPRRPTGTPRLPDFDYAPHRDGDPDPGEVVWTWVPYEDDPTRGKDRPVLVLARSGPDVVVAQLSSQDHDRDAADEARWGRFWHDIGSGDWDPQGRPSEVRLDRLMRVRPADVRREGGVLDERLFREVVARLEEVHGAG